MAPADEERKNAFVQASALLLSSICFVDTFLSFNGTFYTACSQCWALVL